jgi:hypothetical protein
VPEHFVPTVFALLSLVYLFLYVRDYLRQRETSNPARKAWLRIGLIFGAVSLVLFYLH